jgi:hypothetical protein
MTAAVKTATLPGKVAAAAARHLPILWLHPPLLLLLLLLRACRCVFGPGCLTTQSAWRPLLLLLLLVVHVGVAKGMLLVVVVRPCCCCCCRC